VTAGSLPQVPRAARHRKSPPPPPPVAVPARSRAATRGRAARQRRAAGIARQLAYVLSRLIACAGLCGLAALVYRKIFQIRVFEAWLSSRIVAKATSLPTGYWHKFAGMWFAPTPSDQIGLIITPECTVALLVIPFLLITAVTVWLRTPLRWPLTALAAAVVLLVTINQLRLLTVVWFIRAMGNQSGFYWGHTLVGSLITIAGIGLSLLVYSLIFARRGKAALKAGNAARSR
jgi:exosortase/archaeosortase family protein